MSLTLYWNLGSQPARAVKCLLDLGKISAKLVSLEIGKQTRSNEYLKLNPFGKIPFLVDGNCKISESNAIMVYLCEQYPEKLGKYYGNTPKDRAKVNQFLNYYQNFFRPSLFKIIELKIYGGLFQGKTIMENQIQAAYKDMRASLRDFQTFLKVGGTDYVAGNHLTIADLQFYFELTNYTYYEKSFDEFSLITSWFNRIEEIQEVKNITKQWLKLAPGVIQKLKNVPVQPKSKL